MDDARTYTCVESFCGAGGLALGLEQAGFEVVSAFDFDEPAVQSFNRYHGAEIARVAEVRDLAGTDLVPDHVDLDLFSGGPPCQGFSKQKRGAHEGDERNHLVLEYARLVREISPRLFMLENVKMFGKKRGRQFVERLGDVLSDYVFYPHFYNTADYGVAQTRERFILVGKRGDIEAPFSIPAPTVEQWMTVRAAIGDLPAPPSDRSEHQEIRNHQEARISAKNRERISHVPPGGGWQDIPVDLRLKCHRNVDTSSGGWPDVYGRLEWDGQAPTITVGFDNFSRGRYGHPEADRAITHREGARFQGFPDDFEFVGNKDDTRRQIGNAVPPPLAEAIGTEIRRTLMIEDDLLSADDHPGELSRTMAFQQSLM